MLLQREDLRKVLVQADRQQDNATTAPWTTQARASRAICSCNFMMLEHNLRIPMCRPASISSA